MPEDTGVYFSEDTITPTLDGMVFGASERSIAAVEEIAPEILDYAQFNAPWSDRTGAARAGLDVEVYEEFGFVVLDLFHSVDYGLWLEVIQNGRFATIMPTLEIFAPEVMARTGAVFTGETEGEIF